MCMFATCMQDQVEAGKGVRVFGIRVPGGCESPDWCYNKTQIF